MQKSLIGELPTWNRLVIGD